MAIKGFSANKNVKLFRVIVSTGRTDYVATNDLSQSSLNVAQEVCKIRWKIEEFHREIKQLTGIESCQYRKAHLQRNHIACDSCVSPASDIVMLSLLYFIFTNSLLNP